MLKNPVVRRFCKRKVSVIALIVLLIFILAGIFGPIVWRVDPIEQNYTERYASFSLTHPLGTDNLGRDTLSRMLNGARTSLSISFVGVFLGTCVGAMLGVLAGYFGGWVDTVIGRFIDVLLAFPGLLLAITIVAILGAGTENTMYAIAIFGIPNICRMVRGYVIRLKKSEHVEAAIVMGSSHARIIFTHIIPNAVSQIIVNVTLNLGTAILTASSLSYLGLGVTAPYPEWGAMLSTAREVIMTHPVQVLIPGLTITIVVMSFSLVGDGLRDALDPRLKNS